MPLGRELLKPYVIIMISTKSVRVKRCAKEGARNLYRFLASLQGFVSKETSPLRFALEQGDIVGIEGAKPPCA